MRYVTALLIIFCFVHASIAKDFPSPLTKTRATAMVWAIRQVRVKFPAKDSQKELDAFQSQLKKHDIDDRTLDFEDRLIYYASYERMWNQGLLSISDPELRKQLSQHLEQYKLLAVGPFEYLRLSGFGDRSDLLNDAKEMLRREVELESAELKHAFTKCSEALPLRCQEKLGRRLGFPVQQLGTFYLDNPPPYEMSVDSALRMLGGIATEVPFASRRFELLDMLAQKELPKITSPNAVAIARWSVSYCLHQPELSRSQRARVFSNISVIAGSISPQSIDASRMLVSICQQCVENPYDLTADQLAFLRFGEIPKSYPNRFHVVEVEDFASNSCPSIQLGKQNYAIAMLSGKEKFSFFFPGHELLSFQRAEIMSVPEGEERFQKMQEVLLPQQSLLCFQLVFLPVGPLNFFSSPSMRADFELSDREFEAFATECFRQMLQILANRNKRLSSSFIELLEQCDSEVVKKMENECGMSLEEIATFVTSDSIKDIDTRCCRWAGFFKDYPQTEPKLVYGDR